MQEDGVGLGQCADDEDSGRQIYVRKNIGLSFVAGGIYHESHGLAMIDVASTQRIPLRVLNLFRCHLHRTRLG